LRGIVHPVWDIVYYSEVGGQSVWLAEGPSKSITRGVWDDFNFTQLETDGGSNVAAAWYATGLSIAYTKSDETGLKIADH